MLTRPSVATTSLVLVGSNKQTSLLATQSRRHSLGAPLPGFAALPTASERSCHDLYPTKISFFRRGQCCHGRKKTELPGPPHTHSRAGFSHWTSLASQYAVNGEHKAHSHFSISDILCWPPWARDKCTSIRGIGRCCCVSKTPMDLRAEADVGIFCRYAAVLMVFVQLGAGSKALPKPTG